MATRTTSKIVTFTKPFVLGDIDEVLPAGDYVVDTDENLIEGLSFAAYFRASTTIYLPNGSSNPRLWRSANIDPQALDMALARDRETPATADGDRPPVSDGCQLPADRRANERAENEGMIIHVQKPS